MVVPSLLIPFKPGRDFFYSNVNISPTSPTPSPSTTKLPKILTDLYKINVDNKARFGYLDVRRLR
jgi:hypothetical protein